MNKTKHNFRKLDIWKDAMSISKDVFNLLKAFPENYRNPLYNQILRSAISVPSNIAEGSGRDSNKEFNQYLNIALSSAYELETQLLLAESIEYAESKKIKPLIESLNKLEKMISKFQAQLKI